MSPKRARDPGLRLDGFLTEVWYACPRCDGPATPFPETAAAQVICRRCAHVAPLSSGLKYYLTAKVRGNWLWAYNLTHLDALAAWVGASLRERPVDSLFRNQTMMARLPRWMSSASARPHVLKALSKLRQRALDGGLS